MKLIYLGCLSKKAYKSTCENAIKIIKLLDSDYQDLDDVPCCGALSFHITSEKDLKEHVQFVNNWFKENGVTDLVTICAGCYSYLTNYYPKYLGSDFNVKVQHLLQFMNQPEYLEKLNLKYEGEKLVITYHDPCHLRSGSPKIIEEPRSILNNIEGNIILKEIEYANDISICCGAGGGVYSSFKDNSDYNSNLIFQYAKKTRAKALLTPCPFCYTSLKRIKEENKKIRIPVIKFEDFIYKLIEGGDPIV